MHYRYKNKKIEAIFDDPEKMQGWQRTELAVVQAYAERGDITLEIANDIQRILQGEEIDIPWWKDRDGEIGHDLNAFLDERLRYLPENTQHGFHKGITSYDTEESAFVLALRAATSEVTTVAYEVLEVLRGQALKYRYTPMLLRTHGQGAEVGTFGKRIIGWYREFSIALNEVLKARENLKYSKISGACGGYTSIDPEIERIALTTMGLEPFYGATQIMPRVLYVPLASALCAMSLVMDKILTDIRLGARSGPFVSYREPFGKKQKGSSAMPHKKNTITSEQEEGLGRLAQGYLLAIELNIKTWEERAIEQSCVERVAWPDLFHVVRRGQDNLKKIISGLEVFPGNMAAELVSTKGCYATTEAQRVIKELVTQEGLTAEDGYRMIQIAAYNLHAITEVVPPQSLKEAEALFYRTSQLSSERPDSYTLADLMENGWLQVASELEFDEATIQNWNDVLKKIFRDEKNVKMWTGIFTLSHLLRNEHVIFEEVLGVEKQ